MNEEDLENISYNEPQEDLFAGESINAAANKVIDFDEFKQEQEWKLQNYNDQLINDAETFIPTNKKNKKQVDKAALIAARKISKKYKNIYGKKGY